MLPYIAYMDPMGMAIIIGFISEVMAVIYVPNCMYNPYCAPQVQREKEREGE